VSDTTARTEHAVTIEATASQVFGFVAAEWETDLSFVGGGDFDWSPARPARLRTGFRVRCSGGLLGVSRVLELEVVRCDEPGGWVACTVPDAFLRWEWRFAEAGRGCLTTQACAFRPNGWRGWLVDRITGRRRRRATIESSLDRLKLLVEREASLERLRNAASSEGRKPACTQS